MRPFTHLVRLKGKKGVVTNITRLFNGGAMVNLICKAVYTSMKDHLGNLLPSSCTLYMADGTHVPSAGRWAGDVHLKSPEWSTKTSTYTETSYKTNSSTRYICRSSTHQSPWPSLNVADAKGLALCTSTPYLYPSPGEDHLNSLLETTSRCPLVKAAS